MCLSMYLLCYIFAISLRQLALSHNPWTLYHLSQHLKSKISLPFAQHLLALLPAITPASAVHDNACGPGIVTLEILAHYRAHPFSPRPSLSATDISAAMIAGLRDTLRETLVRAGFREEKVRIEEREERRSADIVLRLMMSDFTAGATQGYTDEEKARWASVARECLTEEERETGLVRMVAWLAVAEK